MDGRSVSDAFYTEQVLRVGYMARGTCGRRSEFPTPRRGPGHDCMVQSRNERTLVPTTRCREVGPSESQLREGIGGVGIRRDAHLAPALSVRCARRLGFAGVAYRVAAQEEMRGETFARRQAQHDLGHARRVAVLLAPQRPKCLDDGAHGWFVI